jgi:hypothetical protein
MVKFGILKSKIEKVLVESYTNNTFKEELKRFKTYVLENKNISKLFYLYDELNSKRGLNEFIANDYINECITIYENTINKVREKDILKLKNWVGNIKTENEYTNIDDLFSNDVLTIESKIKSKKLIKESLTKPRPIQKEYVSLPLSTMVGIANKTISNYVGSLNESEKKELIEFLNTNDSSLENDFNVVKQEVVTKLTNLKEGSDSETLSRINETIQKVSSEKCDKFTLFKLKKLKENL